MSTSIKFNIKFNDFHCNVNTAFRDMRKDCDFTDVTLTCEDSHQIEAHKLILAASSPLFQDLLKRNKHAHPLIYMRGMMSVDFLYYGEAHVYQNNLDTFLNFAEEFQLKGLSATEDRGGEGEEDGKHITRQNYNLSVPSSADGQRHNNDILNMKIESQINLSTSQTNPEDQITYNTVVSPSKQDFSGDMKELDEKIRSLMSRGENMIKYGAKSMTTAYVCKVCGKEGRRHNIESHIEANHLEGVTVPCNLCEKTLRTREALRHHNSRCHTAREIFNWADICTIKGSLPE